MYVIRITTATSQSFYWTASLNSSVARVYSKYEDAETVLFHMRHVHGDRRQIIRLPFTGN